MSTFNLDAEIRTDLGKGASRRLRHANLVPAIIYGDNKEPVSITLAHNKLFKAQEDEAFYSSILKVIVAGETVDVIVKDIQRHSHKPRVLHMDFLRVDANSEIHTAVPVHFLGEEAATKLGATVSHHVTEIQVACLPANLPEFIEVNVEGLELGQTLHLSDVALPEGVSSVELAKGEDHDQAVVTLNAPKAGGSDDEEESEEEAAAE